MLPALNLNIPYYKNYFLELYLITRTLQSIIEFGSFVLETDYDDIFCFTKM